MAFCKFTRTSTEEPIYVNPNQVVAVYPYENGAVIWTTATGNESPHRFQVNEKASDVVKQLDLYAKD